MNLNLTRLLNDLPDHVDFNDIIEPDELDERISAVGCLFAYTIDVQEDGIEFCPNNEPPTLEEKLSWLWTIDPTLTDALLELPLSDNLKLLIESYHNRNMGVFWEKMQ